MMARSSSNFIASPSLWILFKPIGWWSTRFSDKRISDNNRKKNWLNHVGYFGIELRMYYRCLHNQKLSKNSQHGGILIKNRSSWFFPYFCRILNTEFSMVINFRFEHTCYTSLSRKRSEKYSLQLSSSNWKISTNVFLLFSRHGKIRLSENPEWTRTTDVQSSLTRRASLSILA